MLDIASEQAAWLVLVLVRRELDGSFTENNDSVVRQRTRFQEKQIAQSFQSDDGAFKGHGVVARRPQVPQAGMRAKEMCDL